ncbi:MAG TPA: MarR family transcriptional regulator, partial [Acidimicrobiales bacterium]
MATTEQTTPHWLDDDEQRTWRAYLRATHLLNVQLERELQRDSGLSHADYQILVQLSEAPDRRLRMSELATFTQSSRSRLSHAVARLERAGWVGRESCPTDKRGAFAVLTEAGFATLAAAAPAHVEGVRAHLFDQLTDDQVRQLGEIAGAIGHHLEPLAA